jgi:hypothetical protein
LGCGSAPVCLSSQLSGLLAGLKAGLGGDDANDDDDHHNDQKPKTKPATKKSVAAATKDDDDPFAAIAKRDTAATSAAASSTSNFKPSAPTANSLLDDVFGGAAAASASSSTPTVAAASKPAAAAAANGGLGELFGPSSATVQHPTALQFSVVRSDVECTRARAQTSASGGSAPLTPDMLAKLYSMSAPPATAAAPLAPTPATSYDSLYLCFFLLRIEMIEIIRSLLSWDVCTLVRSGPNYNIQLGPMPGAAPPAAMPYGAYPQGLMSIVCLLHSLALLTTNVDLYRTTFTIVAPGYTGGMPAPGYGYAAPPGAFGYQPQPQQPGFGINNWPVVLVISLSVTGVFFLFLVRE